MNSSNQWILKDGLLCFNILGDYVGISNNDNKDSDVYEDMNIPGIDEVLKRVSISNLRKYVINKYKSNPELVEEGLGIKDKINLSHWIGNKYNEEFKVDRRNKLIRDIKKITDKHPTYSTEYLEYGVPLVEELNILTDIQIEFLMNRLPILLELYN